MIKNFSILIAFGAVFLHNSCTIGLAYKTNEKGFSLTDYSIGDTIFNLNMTELNLSNRLNDVSNSIGSAVEAGDVSVELLDFGCFQTRNKTGLEVEVSHTNYISSPLTYDLEINPDLIAASPGGFVHFNDDSNFSNGTIDFCIRVTTYAGSFSILFLETNFQVPFLRWNDTITLTNAQYGMLEQIQFGWVRRRRTFLSKHVNAIVGLHVTVQPPRPLGRMTI